jgi:bifunctional non-homologous end joining protein LigD
MPKADRLPLFIPPMLTTPGNAFDSAEHLFEIKWDGTRTLCFAENGGYRLVNRRQFDMTERYLEFAGLRALPSGTVLDGEMVVLKDGKPDFTLLLSREQARSPLKRRTLSRAMPATYMVFDLLYDRGRSVMDLTLVERRKLLEERLATWQQPGLILSQGVVGPGLAFFEKAVAEGLEGVIAKRLSSKYQPGHRTGAWIKIKRSLELCCLVIGFLPSGKDDFRSLILAAEENGTLRCVGKVGTGIDDALRRRINRTLWTHLRPKPVIPCPEKGKWVEPILVCRVSCLERSARGELRAPVFEELIEP